ncbi:leucyl aminopeptidase [Rhodophyticola sp. CCM32]|uniref:leucyl aminopeptidase n=1 Tax=Rhodophyticola sp. CCM32 TaxID=2916397 RepID=UPI00107FBFB7|nr:leucyl aminopeptidase [Rhodophyticola sp. CCM32]QBX99979.1 leucyl aminopeptidase [Rhodophyticola sp. CCM32]
MTTPIAISFVETALDAPRDFEGKIAVFATGDGKIDIGTRRVNRLTKGAVARLLESDRWGKVKEGEGFTMGFPAGLLANALLVVKLPRRPSVEMARKAGASLAKFKGDDPLLVTAGNITRIDQMALGLALRAYSFTAHKTADQPAQGAATIMCSRSDEVSAAAKPAMALADGVFFTRDLVNAPANILTTEDFAARLSDMRDLGLEVEVLEEKELAKLGMGALLGVGQGSDAPSKVVVMTWNGGEKEAPLALVGKGVVFDTGGISLKPAAGMEDMTMDMGGAGVVSGVMRTLALRKAKANVVGLVGLVENMPGSNAQRPGDVVTSMKGDTIEVINTDAEGRLVLADVMWYAQDRFAPSGMVDLATLTGAIVVGLGHENAGVFSNEDVFCNAFLKAARAEGEGAWRMPLGAGYDKLLKSPVADMQNIGGRPAGAITAAQFLQRFVKDEIPWIHLDIAGVAASKSDRVLAPKGATGWGVLALDRLIRDNYES